jgi:RNA polymerase sigma-70 factor (ECF subfamily)
MDSFRQSHVKRLESDIFPKYDESALDFGEGQTLLAGMIGNQPAAWREFQKRYDRLIIRCITNVTQRFSSIVAQDDIRDIRATLYLSLLSNDKRQLRAFDPRRGTRFSNWIGLLAINCAYDYLRTLKHQPQKELLAKALDLACDVLDPFDHAAERERALIARGALKGLSKKNRTFAALYFGEGMEPTEIAERMNISAKTVYSKKHKIQSLLASALAGRGGTFSRPFARRVPA